MSEKHTTEQEKEKTPVFKPWDQMMSYEEMLENVKKGHLSLVIFNVPGLLQKLYPAQLRNFTVSWILEPRTVLSTVLELTAT